MIFPVYHEDIKQYHYPWCEHRTVNDTDPCPKWMGEQLEQLWAEYKTLAKKTQNG